MPEFRESFARELKKRVLARGSIAQACALTAINRQQFNKYLAAQILPGSRNLRKICVYLGISEADLMSGRPRPAITPTGQAEIDWASLPPGFADFRHAPATVLRNGFYRAYFPVHGQAEIVARWLVHVYRGPHGGQVHSCRNRFDDGPALGFASDLICYRGPVGYGAAEACLIGTARRPRPMHGTIYVNLRPVEGPDYFSALVLTRRASGPLAMSGAMHFLGEGCTARQALAGRGTLRLDDPEADPVIVRLMQAAAAAGPSWIQSVTEANLRAESGPGGSDLPAALKIRRLSV